MRFVPTINGSFAILLLSAAAALPQDDPVVSRGLRHTSEGRDVAQTAIDHANSLLSKSNLRFDGSWTPTSSAKDSALIPIYLIEAPSTAASTHAAVPRGCRCVFVNPSLLAAFVDRHSKGTGRLGLDAPLLLSFMLLHEAGHIRRDSAGVQFDRGEMSQLNIEPSKAKASEEEADEFAAVLIRENAKPGRDVNSFLTANGIAMQLTNLGWNMQAYRTLDEFGAAATAKRSVYFDQNYSHPNLAWRILRSNYLIQQTPVAKQLLESFEEIRRRGLSPEPIYKRD